MGKFNRGPINGYSFLRTPGHTGRNDAADPNNPVLIADRRGPVGSQPQRREVLPSKVKMKTPLKVDADDQNPAHLVLGAHEIIYRYVRKVKTVFSEWNSMTANQRGTFLVDAAMEEIVNLKIPRPNIGGTYLDAAGVFHSSSSTWAIGIKKEILTGSGRRAIAEAAATVIHEFEHLATKYVAAQYLASKKGSKINDITSKLSMPDEIATHAIADPLKTSDKARMALGKTCLFRVTSESRRNKNTKPRPGSPFGRSSYEVTKMRMYAAIKKRTDIERSSNINKNEYFRALDDEKAIRNEYRASNTEIGSTLIMNIVKSLLLR